MKFLILFIGLVAATPVAELVARQLGGGGSKSFACQHDHLHTNPDCKGGAGGGKGAGGYGGKGAGGYGGKGGGLGGKGGAGGLGGLLGGLPKAGGDSA